MGLTMHIQHLSTTIINGLQQRRETILANGRKLFLLMPHSKINYLGSQIDASNEIPRPGDQIQS